MLQGIGPGEENAVRPFDWNDYERLVSVVKHDLDSLEYNIYHTWMLETTAHCFHPFSNSCQYASGWALESFRGMGDPVAIAVGLESQTAHTRVCVIWIGQGNREDGLTNMLYVLYISHWGKYMYMGWSRLRCWGIYQWWETIPWRYFLGWLLDLQFLETMELSCRPTLSFTCYYPPPLFCTTKDVGSDQSEVPRGKCILPNKSNQPPKSSHQKIQN